MNFPRTSTLFLLSSLAALLPSQSRQFEVDPNRAPVSFLPDLVNWLDAADCDGDGDVDLAVDGWAHLRRALVLLRDQNGVWQREQLFATTLGGWFAQQTTILPTWADLDGDGDPDLLCVAGNAMSGGVIEFNVLRNVSGAMQLIRTTRLNGAHGARPVVGDTDGDGDLDVLLAIDADGGMTLGLIRLVHDGQLGFGVDLTAVPPVAPGSLPVLADFDGDGDLDVLAAEASGALLRLTNVAGRFTLASSVPGNALAVAAGDLDGDGDADALVLDRDGRVELLRNLGGVFTPTQIQASGVAPSARSLQLADVDGDQDLDAVFSRGGHAVLLRNDGGGAFASETMAHGLQTGGVTVAADFTRDGRVDLLVQLARSRTRPQLAALIPGSPGSMRVDPLTQRGLGMSTTTNNGAAAGGDLDGDLRDEVVETALHRVVVHHNQGAGRFAEVIVPTPFWTCRDMELGDLDGDGDQDLVLCGDATTSPALMTVRNDGAMTFVPLPLQPRAAFETLALGDLDRDGDADVLASDGNRVQVLWSVGGGALQQGPVIATGTAGRIRCCAVADFDGDGDLDVAVGAGDPCIAVLQNDGSGAFPVTVPCAISSSLPHSPWRMVVANVDADADLDLVVASEDTLQVFRNDGAANFTAITTIQTPGETLVFAVADFDGDRGVDIVYGSRSPLRLLWNDGTGTLVDAGTSRWGVDTGIQSMFLTVCQLDEDGDPDFYSSVFDQPLVYNHLRALASRQVPVPGGALVLRATHAAGFAPAGLMVLPCLSLAPRPLLVVPGIDGKLGISLAAGAVLPIQALAPTTGGADITIGIPALASLIGQELFAQALFLPGLGLAPAWSPVVVERIGWR